MMVNIFFRMNVLLLLDHVPQGFGGFAGFAAFAKMSPGKRHGAPELSRQGSPWGTAISRSGLNNEK